MVSVIINYCSNERIFIDAVLTECSKFSDDIVVSYGSKLYDGSPEDIDHMRECAEKYSHVFFVEYDVDLTTDLSRYQRPTAYWHNKARYAAVCALRKNDWVFVIDCDEIPEGDRVKEWLDRGIMLDKRFCYKLSNYWYFKLPTAQATTHEDSVLLIHKDYLTAENIFSDYERDDTIRLSGRILLRQIRGLDGLPMWHHYSAVRSKEGLRHKFKHWGHSNDAFKDIDVDGLIAYIYHNNDVNDVVHQYQYVTVPNRFNIVTE